MNLRQTLRWPVNLLRQWFPSPVDGVGRTILQPILQNLLQDFLSAIFVFFRFTGCKTPLYVFLHGLWPVLGSVRNQVNSFMVWTYIKKRSESNYEALPCLSTSRCRSSGSNWGGSQIIWWCLLTRRKGLLRNWWTLNLKGPLGNIELHRWCSWGLWIIRKKKKLINH